MDNMDSVHSVDVIYTDFSKAFDTVKSGVLLHELKECGVMGKVGCWLSSFLDPKTRQQAVAVDGRVSSLTSVMSGVPQGTVLGPVLFLIHIRNISKDLSAATSASSFDGISSPEDCSDLQDDLQLVYNWAGRSI